MADKYPEGTFRTDIVVEVELTIRVLDMEDQNLPLNAKQRIVVGYDPNDDLREQILAAAWKQAEDLGAMAEPVAFRLAV